jgi:hypothetical protein
MNEHDNNELRNFNEGTPMRGSGMRRVLPIGIAAGILIIAAIIFSAAGPDRTRTAQHNDLNPNTTAAKQAPAAESGIPPSGSNAPTATQEAPRRSNPAGTQ